LQRSKPATTPLPPFVPNDPDPAPRTTNLTKDFGGTELGIDMPISDHSTPGSQEDTVHRSIRKTRQESNSSSLSFASESSINDKPEWFTKDTSVQYQMTPAEQDPAVGFFCKLALLHDIVFLPQTAVVHAVVTTRIYSWHISCTDS
jgi:hypothetical protein